MQISTLLSTYVEGVCVTGLLICCGITRPNFKLARSLFFITQNSLGTAIVRTSLLGSPAPSPSHPPYLTFLGSWRLPYLDHRRCPAIHMMSHAQLRFCVCNPTSHRCPLRHVPLLCNLALQAFHKVF